MLVPFAIIACYVKDFISWIQEIIVVLSPMLAAPKVLYPLLILMFIAACLVIMHSDFRENFAQILAATTFIIAFAWTTYVRHWPAPVVNCSDYLDNTTTTLAACEATLAAYCSSPLEFNRESTGRSLPYIENEDYIWELQSHVCALPVKRTLIACGPKSIGKSEGLSRARSAWIKQGRKVVRMEMKGFTGNYSDFLDALRQHILNFGGNLLTQRDILVLQQCFPTPHPLPYQTKNGLAWLLHFLGFDIQENEFTIWDNYVTSIFNQNDITMVDFRRLLDLLDLIALLHPEKGPILILSEVQSLDKLGKEGSALLRTIVVTLERIKRLIPIIFETSDALWSASISFQESVRRSREAFKGVLVKSFTKEEGHQALVLDRNFLTKGEYDTLWKALGGHAGSWDIVCSRLSTFYSVQEAIDIELNEIQKLLRGVIRGFPGNESEITAQLTELSKNSNFVAKLNFANPAVQHLVDTNVLFRHDYDTFSPQYKLMETAIQKYLDEKLVPMH